MTNDLDRERARRAAEDVEPMRRAIHRMQRWARVMWVVMWLSCAAAVLRWVFR